ncbi:MAG: fumarate reductase subunit D [Succinivibrio sp.]|nr:fumarate reductase subunit D [Succinivibrio sp.]
MRQFLPSRSDEPIYWLMFGAGGMVAAIALPSLLVLLIVAGLTAPDLTSGMLNFSQISGLLGNWFLSLILFGIVFLLCFYSLHRIHHSSHDFGIHSKITFFMCYGLAAALAFGALALQILIYCKLF